MIYPVCRTHFWSDGCGLGVGGHSVQGIVFDNNQDKKKVVFFSQFSYTWSTRDEVDSAAIAHVEDFTIAITLENQRFFLFSVFGSSYYNYVNISSMKKV